MPDQTNVSNKSELGVIHLVGRQNFLKTNMHYPLHVHVRVRIKPKKW